MKKFIKSVKLGDVIPFAAFIVIFLFFQMKSNGRMMSIYNLRTLLDQSMITILLGIGVVFVVAQGSIDLSVGVNLALSGVIATYIAVESGTAWLMIPVALIVAAVVGAVVGLIVSKLKVPSFMVTIAMLIGVRGIVNYIQTKIGVQYIPETMRFLNTPGVKIAMFAAVTLIIAYVFEFTKIGHYSRAIGENETTARFIGIPVSKMKIAAFTLSGLLAGVGAIFSLITVGGTSNTMGSFMEMKVAMAIFFGGVLVTGGTSAKIYKVILGSLSINMIVNGLALIGKSQSEISEAVEGILLLLVLLAAIVAHKYDTRKVKI